MLRHALIAMSRSDELRRAVMASPLTAGVVERFVAGESVVDALAAVRALTNDGLTATIDHLGEHTTDPERAETATQAYLSLLDLIAGAGLAGAVEVSVKLSALGQALPDGEAISTAHARQICAQAAQVGTTVTVDMEDHTTTAATLRTLDALWPEFPETGVVLQSALHRTERDCRNLADRGVRVRLCKGAYEEPAAVAYTKRRDIDRSYVRCLNVLLSGSTYPMIASHDPRLIDIAASLAIRHGRAPGEYEFQMLFGVRADEQRRLVAEGERVRVYVPYGEDWWAYLVRRLAEKPANLALFLRAVASAA
jgi:proline dehydrogenase